MEQVNVDAQMILARQFIAEARKWGRHTVQPFNTIQLLEVFEAYEQRVADAATAHEQALLIKDEAHQRLISELNGKIGGLTKKLNKQSD